MIPTNEAVHWIDHGVLRVGLWTHAPSARQLDLGESVAVIIPARSMRLAIDATTPGRRYRAVIMGPAVGVLPACRTLQIEEESPGPLVVMALDSDFVRAGLAGTPMHMAGVPHSVDPYLRRAGATMMSAIKHEVVPNEVYFDFLAHNLRDHLCSFYTRRRRQQATPPLREDRLALATQCMRENFSDKDLSVGEVASSVCLSPFHFTRMFTMATGTAPHAFLTQIRLEHARKLLGDTCLAIAEVANRCGYATHAHFTGVFGRHVGMTPANYRLHVRAERAAARPKPAGSR